MTTQDEIIKTKLGLLQLATHLNNVSQACRTIGYSRDNYYRIKKLYETGGEAALQELSRRKPNHKNRVDPAIEEQVIAIAGATLPWPASEPVTNWPIEDLLFLLGACEAFGSVMTWRPLKKCLTALEAKVAREGIILTEV